MHRKPIHLTHTATKVTGRDAIWLAIRELKQFTYADIVIKTSENEYTVRTYLQGLNHAEYIKVIGKDHRDDNTQGIEKPPTRRRANLYKLINDIGIDAPRVRKDGTPVTQGQAREQMWRTIKIIGEFNYTELAANASTETCLVAPHDAKSYIGNLHKAGYLHITTKAGRHTGLARYRLLPSKNTGPKPPKVQRVKNIYDPNLGKIVWQQEVTPE